MGNFDKTGNPTRAFDTMVLDQSPPLGTPNCVDAQLSFFLSLCIPS